MDIEDAKETYLRLVPELESANTHIKSLRKTEAKCKKAFKKYVKEHGPLTITGKTFRFEQKEKVVLTMDRVEEAFPARDVENYKHNNMEQVEVFKAS